MANYKPGRLGGEIQKTIGELLVHGVKDPRLTDAMICITGVDVSRDGSYATCYVSIFDPETEESVLEGLKSAKGMFKKEIANRIKVRHIPELIFKPDHSAQYGAKIDAVLDTIDFSSYQKDEPSEDQEEK